jgi:hypothetical protein
VDRMIYAIKHRSFPFVTFKSVNAAQLHTHLAIKEIALS